MAIVQRKNEYGIDHALRDTRALGARAKAFLSDSTTAGVLLFMLSASVMFMPLALYVADAVLLVGLCYLWWLAKCDRTLCFKMPKWSRFKDRNERDGVPKGILFLGNSKQYHNEECWFTNNDARTHILYLGTTGAGKTEGLKSIASNALMWGSGFIYVDGKADTDLWSSISAMVRRFGRDDDLLLLNYMTGNSDDPAPSNTLNPFSSGSSSYLTQLLVSLMPEAGGDNAMWKERAISLLSALMPALTWKRDHEDVPLSINAIRQVMNFPEIIKLSRDAALPERIREGLKGYLDTLPGYVDAAFDDNGMDKPLGPDQPQVDSNVVKQQHGYLTMQFTRALQSLGNDYGYIFEAKNADIEMIDVVLNRRILVVMIPALEKSPDEAANLGKIVAATLKGMMGATLGATIEGESATVIDNKATRSATPFITIFDEVGYYTTPGMGVMAAQARSLGFCLVYAAQDIAAMEKRIKEEAQSITGNCNIKIFGKLEDPLGSAEFFERTVGKALVTVVGGWENPDSLTSTYFGNKAAKVHFHSRASMKDLRNFKQGDAVLCFGMTVNTVKLYYAKPPSAKAMRVQRFVGLPKTSDFLLKHSKNIGGLRDRLMSADWTAEKAAPPAACPPELQALIDGASKATDAGAVHPGTFCLMNLLALRGDLDEPLTFSTTEALRPAAAHTQSDRKERKDQKESPPALPGGKHVNWEKMLDDDHIEEEEEEGGKGKGGSSGGSKAPVQLVSKEDYDPRKAVETKAKSGVTMMPEGLTDEVRAILKNAADTLSAGLFGTPELRAQASSGDARTIKPGNAPIGGSPMKR